MNYKLERNNIINEKKLRLINTNKKYTTYKYNNYALCIYNNLQLKEEEARAMTSIRTTRILLPKKLLFNKNKLVGYTLKLVPTNPKSKNIISLPKEHLINDIKLLEEDIHTISNKKILLNGMNQESTIYNGSIYITEPSKYSILDIDSTKELEKLNNYQLSILLNSLISKDLNTIQGKYPGINYLKELLESKDSDTSYSEYLDNIIEQNSNIKTLVKKL